jgi:hypothetical protein
MLAGWVRRSVHFAAALGQPVAQLLRVIGAIGDQDLWSWNSLEHVAEVDQVMRLFGERRREWPSRRIGQGMNLGHPSAARSPDGTGEVPPFCACGGAVRFDVGAVRRCRADHPVST